MIAMSSVATAVIALAAWVYAGQPSSVQNPTALPSQAVFVDPHSFAVLGANATFRTNAFGQLFNPTNTTPPFFQVFHQDFLKILGPSPTLRAVTANPTFAFAHEAPIWDPATDEVFFASNDGGALGMSDIDHNSQVSKISLAEVATAIKAAGPGAAPVNVSVTKLDLPDTIQMTNGGTGPFDGQLVLITSGRGPRPPSIALVNPTPPHNTTVLLDNFFGRQFNSLNDIKVLPGTNKLFFTDVTYGFLNHFRPAPLMPNQVYRFDPDTSAVRVVADGFDKCNGIIFSPDGSVAYVTDTGATGGFLGSNQTEPATIYAFDVDRKTHAFTNRRVFAFVDTGIADGGQVDAAGNLYAGCGDGAQVWAPDGTLLGKFFLGTLSANLVFAGDGRVVIMAETAIYLAEIAAKAHKVSFP
ncbi:D-lactonohydrolase-like protein [Epithele typhae]|uniref:D-lactonohydrolase-like protein n=1 Tax=Epithele typhae TaxID=378194 RepID=UPI0020082301|nr:D-lactonohydrolase-like protein [Epithele typhae]KAH9913684.1 D-lactonohydrolase-like protein [Epithele typhae]